MKKALKHAIRLLREEEAKADRKTENCSEKPNNSTTEDCSMVELSKVRAELNEWRDLIGDDVVDDIISNLEEVADEDEPQTEKYCDKCNHKGCDNCIADGSNPYCVPSQYKPQTEPLQTCSVNGRPYSECSSCEHFRCTADEPQIECKYAWWNSEAKRYECSIWKCPYNEPKDEPQTKCYLRTSCDHYGDKQVCGRCREYNLYSHTKTEPQTERSE